MDFERYQRQLALPEISVADQVRLGAARVMVVGAGGLGCAALPYLAGAGVGHVAIIDNDTVSISNLHRQVLYTDGDVGQSKAELAAASARALNPDIEVVARVERLGAGTDFSGFDLIIDGSDNFETKSLLNDVSVREGIVLISGSVQQFGGQIGVFAGWAADRPCYHCLFPKLPSDARNCNDAGILGSVAGLGGVHQAHVALCHLLGIGDFEAGNVFSFDFMVMRMQRLRLPKDDDCSVCKDGQGVYSEQKKESFMSELVSLEELNKIEHVVVDVRTDAEVAADPIIGANGAVIHMEVSSVPARYEELPTDTMLAFVCAGNVRSVKAAEYLDGVGYGQARCVLDKFSV
jgi:molybdopterin/thiamine biosynthesis adenylyltransferase/rhodanese-related sulfurtransferase